MKPALQRLDAIHQRLVSTISPLAPDIYAQRPAEGEWSVAEIVHHLYLAEELSPQITPISQIRKSGSA